MITKEGAGGAVAAPAFFKDTIGGGKK